MEIRARYVLIGLFTLAVILGGFAFVYWLETTGGIGKRKDYRITFHNTVSGLLPGSAVLFNGIRVGEVTGLKLLPDRPSEVEAAIAVDWNTPVRADTQASLEFQGLTGVAVVTLKGGSPGAPQLSNEAGQVPSLTADEKAGQSMSEAARQVLGRIDKVLAENSSDIRTMVSNLSSFSEALGRNSGKVDTVFAGLERMTGGGKGTGRFYDLTALPASALPSQPLGAQLAIPDPTSLLAYDSEKILTQLPTGELQGIGDVKWADTVSKLIQTKLIQSFENTGALGEVKRPIEGSSPEEQLLIEIRSFQIETKPGRAANAEITAKLVTGEGHVLGAKVFDAKVPVASQDEAEAAKGLNEAFQKIASSLISWTRSTLASATPKEQLPKQESQDMERKN